VQDPGRRVTVLYIGYIAFLFFLFSLFHMKARLCRGTQALCHYWPM
jgi:hypothetical protein